MAEQTTQTWDVDAARKAQAEYIEREGVPDFAPQSGQCWNCGRNIYESLTRPDPHSHFTGRDFYTTGITVEEAGSRLVTGCPHCHRSYCD